MKGFSDIKRIYEQLFTIRLQNMIYLIRHKWYNVITVKERTKKGTHHEIFYKLSYT